MGSDTAVNNQNPMIYTPASAGVYQIRCTARGSIQSVTKTIEVKTEQLALVLKQGSGNIVDTFNSVTLTLSCYGNIEGKTSTTLTANRCVWEIINNKTGEVFASNTGSNPFKVKMTKIGEFTVKLSDSKGEYQPTTKLFTVNSFYNSMISFGWNSYGTNSISHDLVLNDGISSNVQVLEGVYGDNSYNYYRKHYIVENGVEIEMTWNKTNKRYEYIRDDGTILVLDTTSIASPGKKGPYSNNTYQTNYKGYGIVNCTKPTSFTGRVKCIKRTSTPAAAAWAKASYIEANFNVIMV